MYTHIHMHIHMVRHGVVLGVAGVLRLDPLRARADRGDLHVCIYIYIYKQHNHSNIDNTNTNNGHQNTVVQQIIT